MAIVDYQDETKIIPQGLVKLLESFEGKKEKIRSGSYLETKLIELLGEERYRGSTLDEIVSSIKSLLSQNEKESLENVSIPKEKIEELEKEYNQRQEEILEQEKKIKEEINLLKKQKTVDLNKIRELNEQIQNLPTNQTIETKFEETVSSDIGKTREKIIIPPQKKEPVVQTQKTEEEKPVEKNDFTDFIEKSEKLGKQAELVREQKEQQIEQTKEEARLLAEKISQETVKIIEKETEVTFQNNDKKNEVIEQTAQIAYEVILGDKTLTNEEFVEKVIELIEPNKELITEKDRVIETVVLQGEPIKTIEKWAESHEQQINEIKGKEIENRILEFYKNNKEIKKEQFEPIVRYARLVRDFVATTPNIERLKPQITKQYSVKLNPGKIEKNWYDTKVFAKIASMSPSEFRKFTKEYKEKRSNLGAQIPLINQIIISLENFNRFIEQSPDSVYQINQIQRQKIFKNYSYSSEFFIKLQNFFLRQNNNFVGGIKENRINFFLQNSFGFLKNGFTQGFLSGIKGLFSKTATGFFGFGAKTAVAAGAGAATGGLATLAAGAKKLLNKLGDAGGKFLKSLGINIFGGTKNFLNNNLGIIGSAIDNFVLKGVERTVNTFVTVLLIVLGSFLLLMLKNERTLALVAPITESSQLNDLDLDSSISCDDKTGYINPTKNYPSNTDEKFTLWVFEPGKGGGRLTQKYDLEESALPFSQQHIDPKYNAGTANDKLDSRVIPAYEAMVRAGIASGELSYPDKDLKLTSGYRNKAYQQKLWNDALIKYGSPEAARKYVAPPGCSPHQTGRAIDIYVNGSAGNPNAFTEQRSSTTFQWLSANAYKYGFYNYENEPWHWEYNPKDDPNK